MVEHEREHEPFERISEELKDYTQWINWRVEDEQKVPMNPLTLGNTGVSWPNIWTAFEEATAPIWLPARPGGYGDEDRGPAGRMVGW